MLIATAFASCTNESEDMNRHSLGTPLQLNVKTATIQSRGLIESATLLDGSQIGITLAGDVYSEYDNTVFTASTVNGKQQWNSTKEVLLTSEESVLFSYYPWKEGTDYNAIEIETASQTDYMYGTPVESVSEDNANPTITLNHALANINLTFVKGTYVGEGNVTEVSVHGDGIATGGTFDASITQSYIPGEPLTGIGDKVTVTTATELDGDAVNIMVVPVNVSKSFNVTATIDGVDYTVSTSAVQLEMGSSYKYTLTLNSTMMGVSEVAVTQWNPITKDNLTLNKLITWETASNGVYAVAADGSPVEVANATSECVGVALIQGEHKFMIEKNGEANATSIKAAYTADGATNTEYKYFYWGPYVTDVSGITNWTTEGDGKTIPTDYTTWSTNSTYAWNDFNGKSNTAALLNATDSDNYTTYANAATYCKKFKETATENQGYTDWYIPACGQLSLIYINVTEINAALTKIGGTTFNTSSYDYCYWSSSENSSRYGWAVNFSSGKIFWSNKYSNYRVRLVRDF